MYKIESPVAFFQAFQACLELDHLMLFQAEKSGFLICGVDSYGTSSLQCSISCQVVEDHSGITTEVEVCPDSFSKLKKVISAQQDLFVFIREFEVAFFSSFQTHLCTFLPMKNAPKRKYDDTNIPVFSINLQFSLSDLTATFVNLAAFSGFCSISLSSTGLLLFHAEFELGELSIQRQIDKKESGTALESIPSFKHIFITKFTKLLDSKQQICQILLQGQQNGSANFVVKFHSAKNVPQVLVLRSVDKLLQTGEPI